MAPFRGTSLFKTFFQTLQFLLFKSQFVIDGIKFCTAEQYMMYGKAMLFGDKEIAQEILKTSNPRRQKDLGQKVKNFNEDVWKKNREDIVYKGNYAKFTQDETLKQFLLHPSRRTVTFVEASPLDKVNFLKK